MEELLVKFEKIYSEQTKSSSQLTRNIVFALIALIWAISYDKGTVNITTSSLFSMAILILYLVFDIIQALVASIRYRRIYYSVYGALRSKKDLKDKEEKIEEYCYKTDTTTYVLLLIKISLIPIALVGIAITLHGLIK